MKYLFLFCACITFAQTQKCVPIDEDVYEFISEVNYTLYFNKKAMFSSATSKDTITCLPTNVIWDSIAFSKANYKQTGFKKVNLKEILLLSKVVNELDEIIISNTKPKEIQIGEKSRFIKRYSHSILKDTSSGLLFRLEELNNNEVKKLEFYVEKVKHKTTYKVKFFAAQELGNIMTLQTLKINELLFESPILTLDVGMKNRIDVNLEPYDITFDNKNVFVCLELQDYYDENNNVIQVEKKEATKLKFQLSNRIDYYGKTIDLNTQKLSDELINLNAMINKDFAYMFFKKPHKSNLIAPAIVLYATAIKKG